MTAWKQRPQKKNNKTTETDKVTQNSEHTLFFLRTMCFSVVLSFKLFLCFSTLWHCRTVTHQLYNDGNNFIHESNFFSSKRLLSVRIFPSVICSWSFIHSFIHFILILIFQLAFVLNRYENEWKIKSNTKGNM